MAKILGGCILLRLLYPLLNMFPIILVYIQVCILVSLRRLLWIFLVYLIKVVKTLLYIFDILDILLLFCVKGFILFILLYAISIVILRLLHLFSKLRLFKFFILIHTIHCVIKVPVDFIHYKLFVLWVFNFCLFAFLLIYPLPRIFRWAYFGPRRALCFLFLNIIFFVDITYIILIDLSIIFRPFSSLLRYNLLCFRLSL